MLSNPIELHSKEQPKHSEKVKTKTPSHFSKKEKSKLPQNLENEALEALKEILSRQKQSDNPMAMTNVPFSEKPLVTSNQSVSIGPLEPSLQVTHLYDRLIKALIHVDNNGIQETTIVLNHEEFSSSIFSGSQVTITEFSTAPKIFNIHFQGGPQALAVFQAHAADLAKVMHQAKFGFLIGRIDASLPDDFNKKPKISKIENAMEEEER